MKQGQSQQDRMKHDTGPDQTKKDDIGKDEMKGEKAKKGQEGQNGPAVAGQYCGTAGQFVLRSGTATIPLMRSTIAFEG
jgi:hypothetical protein